MKRIVVVLLLTVILAGMMNVHAAEAEITVQVSASKTEVQVGDTVEYTVLATGTGVVAMQFVVRLPEGLQYVANSGATPENLAQKLGVPAADWTEQTMMFTFYNDVGITFAPGTEILRFSCVAEKEGQWDVELFELLPFDGDFLEFEPKLQVQQVRVISAEGAVTPTDPEQTVPLQPEETTPPEDPTAPPHQEDPVDITQPESVPDPTEQGSGTTQNSKPEEVTQPQQHQQTPDRPMEKTRLLLLAVIGASVIVCAVVCCIVIRKKHASNR